MGRLRSKLTPKQARLKRDADAAANWLDILQIGFAESLKRICIEDRQEYQSFLDLMANKLTPAVEAAAATELWYQKSLERKKTKAEAK